MRSLYKVPFVHKSLFYKYVDKRKKKNVHSELQGVLSRRKVKMPKYLIFFKKSSKLSRNKLIDRKVAVHNGKVHMFVNLKKGVVGFKIGQFIITRRTVVHSSKKMKNKKRMTGKGKAGIFKKRTGTKYNLTLKKFVAKKKIKKWA
jgi:ribosomal protein S19